MVRIHLGGEGGAFTGYLVLEGIFRPPQVLGVLRESVRGSLVVHVAGWTPAGGGGGKEVMGWKVVQGSAQGELKGRLASEEAVGGSEGNEAWIELEMREGEGETTMVWS